MMGTSNSVLSIQVANLAFNMDIEREKSMINEDTTLGEVKVSIHGDSVADKAANAMTATLVSVATSLFPYIIANSMFKSTIVKSLDGVLD